MIKHKRRSKTILLGSTFYHPVHGRGHTIESDTPFSSGKTLITVQYDNQYGHTQLTKEDIKYLMDHKKKIKKLRNIA